MSTPGGLALIHALGKNLTREHGSPANGGKQAQQSMPLVGGQLLAYNDPRRQTGEHSAFGKRQPSLQRCPRQVHTRWLPARDEYSSS
eukprot:144092-Pyramimonas_sp.AAC.1